MVTGDKDLLELPRSKTAFILTPVNFEKVINQRNEESLQATLSGVDEKPYKSPDTFDVSGLLVLLPIDRNRLLLLGTK